MSIKLGILPKTLDNSIVIDGLKAVCELDGVPLSAGLSMVVGGTAVQSYLPGEFRRPTSDIDLSVLRPLNHSEFKSFAQPVLEFLRDQGYEVMTKKGSSNYKVIVQGESQNNELIIEFSRRNPKKFVEKISRLERELEHGRRKTINGSSYLAASPEDIAVPKIVRGVGTAQRHPDVLLEVDQLYSKGVDLVTINRGVLAERAVAEASENPRLYERVRLKADMYDVTCLNKFAGFNDTYLQEAANDWMKTGQSSLERDHLYQLLQLNLE